MPWEFVNDSRNAAMGKQAGMKRRAKHGRMLLELGMWSFSGSWCLDVGVFPELRILLAECSFHA